MAEHNPRSIESKLCQIPTLSPAQSSQCHLQEFLGHLQGWGSKPPWAPPGMGTPNPPGQLLSKA